MTRLRSLSLDRYGIFAGTVLDFGPGLTVVVGPNEAGKSTALHALADLVCGIPPRSALGRLTPASVMQLTARIDLPDTSAEMTAVRLSRGLFGADRTTAVANPWGEDAPDRDGWLTAFGLSHDKLRDGGSQVCRGAGDLASIIYVARQGADLQPLLADLHDREVELYRDHGNAKKSAVRVAVVEYKSRLGETDHALVRASDVLTAQRRVTELQSQHAQAVVVEKAANRDVALLAERQRCLADTLTLTGIRTEIARLSAAGPVLTAGDVAAYDTAVEALRDREREQAELHATIAAVTAERDLLTVDEDLLADATEIDTLHAQLAARIEGRDRAAELHHQAADQDEQTRAQLAELLGRPCTESLDAVLTGLAVASDLAAQLDGAARRHEELDRDRREAADRVQQADAEVRDRSQGPSVPTAAELAQLQAAVAQIEAADGPVAQLRAARHDELDARHRRQTALIDAGAIDPAMPSAPRIDEDELAEALARLDTTRTAVATADQAVVAAEADLRTAAAALAEQTAPAGRPAPIDQAAPVARPPATRAAVSEARRARDDLWATISTLWLHGTAPTGPARAALAVQYGGLLRDADDSADLFADQISRDAGLAAAQQAAHDAQAELSRRNEAQHATHETYTATVAEWTARWAALGLRAPVPARAEAVRHHLLTASHAEVDADRARETIAQLEPEVATWTSTLHRLFGDLRQDPPAPISEAAPDATDSTSDGPDDAVDPLGQLAVQLSRAHSLIAVVDAAREEQELRRAADQALTRARVALTDIERDLGSWEAEWRTLVGAADLPPTTDPTGWSTRSTALASILASNHATQRLRTEAAELDRIWQAFTDAVRAAGTRHGCIGGTPEAILVQLWERLSLCRSDKKTYDDRVATHRAATTALASCTARLQSYQVELAALATKHGLATPEDLAPAADGGRALTALRQDEARCLAQLTAAADPGTHIERLAAALADTSATDLEIGRQQAEHDREQAHHAQQAIAEELGAARQRLAEHERLGDAAALKAAADEKLAEIAELAEQFATLRLQRLILTEALHRHAAQHTSPLLLDAGELLERLTAGRWLALRAEDDGAGNRSLLIVRRDGEQVLPEALSEGTGDQVFLALRLAAIRQRQAERRRTGLPALPIVFDDVLMAFDDDRASRALAVLAELADGPDGMQIVLFTHHEHLATLADALHRPQLRVTRLPRPEDPPAAGDAHQIRTAAACHSAPALPDPGLALDRSARRTQLVRTPSTNISAGPNPSLVRAWARANGFEIGDRGRVPSDLVQRYLDSEHGSNAELS